MLSDLHSSRPGDAIILATEQLGRVSGDVTLVSDITLQVAHANSSQWWGQAVQERVSFLRLLNRLDEPTSGTVYVEGEDYRRIPSRELRYKVGMVTTGISFSWNGRR